MTQSIHKYLKIGTLNWMSFPFAQHDIVSSIKKLACDEYFDAIEICHIEDVDTRHKVKQLLSQSHLSVSYGVQPQILSSGINVNDCNEDARAFAESVIMQAIDEAEFFGASGISFMAGKWTTENRVLSYQQLKKTTVNLCAYAATKGMAVELELFDYDMDKAVLIGPASYARQFAAEIRCERQNFGLLVDLSHLPTTYETPEYVIQVLRPYITHFHFGNAVVRKGCAAYGDKHPRFGFLNSANDMDELLTFLQVLKNEGFFRFKNPLIFSMEVTPQPGEDADIILANTKRVLNRAWVCLD